MPEKAGQCFRSVVQRNPDNIEANTHLGKVLIEAGSHEEAGRLYRRVFELSTDYTDALNALGVILMKKYDRSKQRSISRMLSRCNRITQMYLITLVFVYR
ncbi:MAG TPA: hypothetical protein ENI67_06450 [Gammaproteobacteria bacterium]|nr:hypothetical protein [Gammaproteobacteria bacterium]